MKRSLLSALLILLAVPASAMDFRTGRWKGHPALFASGLIVAGDAARLAQSAAVVLPAAHGHRLLLLSSPGGDVDAALRMVEILDRMALHTVVAKGSSCESACGGLLFIAGALRTVEDGGTIGLHTCYRVDTYAPLPECNEEIALNAVAHGVSHGSLMGAMESTPAQGMTMFSRKWGECWGLTRYAGSEEGGFDRIEPCFILLVGGRTPAAQAVWRINIEEGGFSAFVRTVADYELAGEIKVTCRRGMPGVLHFAVMVPGPANSVRNAIEAADLTGAPVAWSTRNVNVAPEDTNMSRVSFDMPPEESAAFFGKTDRFRLRFLLKAPYQPMEMETSVGGSRMNLAFMKRHCLP